VRYKANLVNVRSSLKTQVHAVLAKEGVAAPMSDLFGESGQALLDTCELGQAYATRVESLRDILERLIEWDWPDAPVRTPILHGDIPPRSEPIPNPDDPAARRCRRPLRRVDCHEPRTHPGFPSAPRRWPRTN